ncbi:hypothetical protein GCWU000342_00168 [Shuttleworthella satelles DSM 14600]|uniref:Uncharacterized protein n=1 Tax=Shuttleworthella satelles DSM 14600 TaxID=626523 RepID=C4G802_9FIRM|nr:hypothetical protein GCWU000342_00168 [Shuttleworthia satelles DSM 14600]
MRDPTRKRPISVSSLIFQSTGPVRDPTLTAGISYTSEGHFNPRVP